MAIFNRIYIPINVYEHDRTQPFLWRGSVTNMPFMLLAESHYTYEAREAVETLLHRMYPKRHITVTEDDGGFHTEIRMSDALFLVSDWGGNTCEYDTLQEAIDHVEQQVKAWDACK